MPTKKNTDMLDTIQQQMKDRLAELQPYVDEYHQIEAALKRMNPRRGRPKGSKNKPKDTASAA